MDAECENGNEKNDGDRYRRMWNDLQSYALSRFGRSLEDVQDTACRAELVAKVSRELTGMIDSPFTYRLIQGMFEEGYDLVYEREWEDISALWRTIRPTRNRQRNNGMFPKFIYTSNKHSEEELERAAANDETVEVHDRRMNILRIQQMHMHRKRQMLTHVKTRAEPEEREGEGERETRTIDASGGADVGSFDATHPMDDNGSLGGLHATYLRALGRCADIGAIESFLERRKQTHTSDGDALLSSIDREISSSSEARCARWFRSSFEHFARDGHASNSNSSSSSSNSGRNAATLVEVFVRLLNYLPRKADFMRFIRFDTPHSRLTEATVVEYVSQTNDFKYLEECRSSFSNQGRRSVPGVVPVRKQKRAVLKYYGPVGTSGYAKVARNIVESLHTHSDYAVLFEPVQFHNYRPNSEDDALLSSLGPGASELRLKIGLGLGIGLRIGQDDAKGGENENENENEYEYEYDLVVVHSPPELWPAICAKERARNRNVRIHGITVWESDRLPLRWSTYVSFVDRVSVPSRFSAVAFRHAGIEADVVHHPIAMDTTMATGRTDKSILTTDGWRERYACIFYNISEWTNRKGLAEVVRSFLHEFHGSKEAMLYLKTYGDIGKEEADVFIASVAREHGETEVYNVLLDCARVSDAYIDDVHHSADCYVSLCKSEGHGVGACYAALYGNRVIITGYGGQVDYLIGGNDRVRFVDNALESACFCTTWSKKHEKCALLPHCRYFDGFIPAQQTWAAPSVEHCRTLMRQEFEVIVGTRELTPTPTIGDEREHEAACFLKRRFSFAVCATAFVEAFDRTRKVGERERVRKVERYMREDARITPSSVLPQRCFYAFGRDHRCGGDSEVGKNRRRVLVVASYGYGNVGDDCYGEILGRLFGVDDGMEVSICPDACVMLKDGSYLHLNKFRTTMNGEIEGLMPFDCVVIGGGGLLSKQRYLHRNKNSLWFYTDLCVERGIPYYVVSVGFQDVEAVHEDKTVQFFRTAFRAFLDNAEYVSVRSVVDYELAAHVMSDSTSLEYHPDMVYGIRPVLSLNAACMNADDRDRNVIMVLVTQWTNVRRGVVVRDVQEATRDGDEVVFMNWGGVDPDGGGYMYDDEVRELFPEACILQGKRPELSWLLNNERTATDRQMTVRDIWALLLRTRLLITGRYHGVVLGKATGVPKVETYGYTNYKFLADELSLHPDASTEVLERTALKPVKKIRDMIAGERRHTYRSWDADQRNTAIVKVHGLTGMDVELLQNWKNRDLEEKLA